ncbi:MAG TPA: hypothetical protein VFN67_33690 [Polyangiales bacterium]|nr:hypothetical protein [Polyangiales bacterium]
MARKILKLHQSRQTVRATPNNPSRPNAAPTDSSKPNRHTAVKAAGRDRSRATYRSAPPSTARGRASSGINKSAFVRSLPSSLSAAEVIEKGKAKGIKLSAAQVYTIRANARRKGPETDAARLVRGARDGGLKGRGRPEGKEAEFVAAALDLGLARAEALIRALRTRASQGWS